MHLISKRRYQFFFLIFFFAILFGHGFDEYTPIYLSNGCGKDISAIYSELLYNNISVTTYDAINKVIINQLVKEGKKSTSNYYIRLGFDYSSQDENDIICAPTQTFYVPALDEWVPAVLLKTDDHLLTKDLIQKPITYKELVPEPLTVYMLEIQQTHTFFVGKHAILTHNFLPVVTLNIASTVSAGLLGPIEITASTVVGGVITIASIAAKIFYKNKISKAKNNHCTANDPYEDDKTPCFTVQSQVETKYVYPIDSTPTINIGCQTETQINKPIKNGCFEAPETPQIDNGGCFQQPESTKQLSCYSQEKAPDNISSRPQKQTARNWKEFEENCPIGQQWGKKFVHTGKQNPKDGSPIRQLVEDIPNTEMFKKGYQFAPDRFHNGDHFEVWDKQGKWIGVANLDGSRNEKKTDAEPNKNSRNLRKNGKK